MTSCIWRCAVAGLCALIACEDPPAASPDAGRADASSADVTGSDAAPIDRGQPADSAAAFDGSHADSGAAFLTVDYLNVLGSEEGASDYFIVTSNVAWQVSQYPAWVEVAPTSGVNTAQVTVTAHANTGEQRTGTIAVSGSGVAPAQLTVTQLGRAAADYYLAPTGDDDNPGTIERPFFSLNKLWTVIQPGQLAYLRGGRYEYVAQPVMSGRSGTAGNLIKVWAYPGETPVITMGAGYSASFGIEFSGNDYVHLKGWEITGFVQPTSGGNFSGLFVRNSNHCIFELLDYHHNGFPFSIRESSDDNLVLNSDFHHQYDPYTDGDPYGNGDGTDCPTAAGTSNTFRGCRSWDNSDDGFDFWDADGLWNIDGCWAWHNGYREDRVTTGGNGDGFKLGRTSTDLSSLHLRTVVNCLAFDNRLGGIIQNGAACIVHAYNNTTYRNTGADWAVGFGLGEISGIAHVLRNNIAHAEHSARDLAAGAVDDHNSWNGVAVGDSDFMSLDWTGVDGPRQADGSLPVVDFLKLAPGSALINSGVDVGLPFAGSAPDLGAFETDGT